MVDGGHFLALLNIEHPTQGIDKCSMDQGTDLGWGERRRALVVAQNLSHRRQHILDITHVPALYQLAERVKQPQQSLTGQLLIGLCPLARHVGQDNRRHQRALCNAVVKKCWGLSAIHDTAAIVMRRITGIDDPMPFGQRVLMTKIIEHRWLTTQPF